MKKDPWKVLGVPRGTPMPEVKRAYHALAREFHPDQCGADPTKTERFKEIAWAYAVLSDPRRKKEEVESPAAGLWGDVVEALVGGQAGELVERIRNEGISAENIDSIFVDFLGIARGVHEELPKRAAKAGERVRHMRPSEVFSLFDGAFGKR